MRGRVLAPALAGVLLFVACGGGEDTGGSVEGEDITVEMYDNRYEYTEIKIPVGGSVNWVGAGRQPHHAIDSDGAWSTETVFGSLDQYEGDEAKLTYDTPGTYVFFCKYHGNAEGDGMAGTLVVGDG